MVELLVEGVGAVGNEICVLEVLGVEVVTDQDECNETAWDDGKVET